MLLFLPLRSWRLCVKKEAPRKVAKIAKEDKLQIRILMLNQMKYKFKTETEILDIVRGFEDATIGRDAWKHAEHLTVALYYVRNFDLETATGKMRSGILNLLTKGFGVDRAVEDPYHETLTVFWMRTVAKFDADRSGRTLLENANELTAVYDKDYPLKFYSNDRLFSDEARAKSVEPDIALID